jgi:cyclopropane-fatty-acyl-phospholipid synthase
MTYSCAVWSDPSDSLERAQEAKYELICRKLDLRPGMRLLDVGCGWGGMAMYAAAHHGVQAVGITLSRPQEEWAQKNAAEEGLADRVDVRLQDYRDVDDGPYDAISSIGMYFEQLFGLLRPGGRMLNHGIARPSAKRARFARHSFIDRYVFPDGELHEVGAVVSTMQERGFEVRHVESLREHYALTLRAWIANLEDHWVAAIAEAGPPRARIWRLYMAASALNFEAGRTQVHQILGVKGDRGRSGMSLRPAFG